jgi:hypothetical protein
MADEDLYFEETALTPEDIYPPFRRFVAERHGDGLLFSVATDHTEAEGHFNDFEIINLVDLALMQHRSIWIGS